MTLGPMQESRPMKQLPDYMQEPDRPRSIDELRCRLNRRLSNMRDGWRRCDNGLCRRWKQCCGEGPEFKCTDDGRPRRTPTPEETAKAISDLYKEIKRRAAERTAGAEPPQEETPRELPYTARAAARRRRKSARALAAKTAAPSPQVHRDEPQAHVAEETQLVPEQPARIDRAWNDDVASQPAQQHTTRERRPRITQL
jgi:hypothetical protein